MLIIFLSFPVIIFFLWFRKNKSKIKPFYKRNKKIFNRIYFYLGSVFSLIPIACIVGIIATGSVSNFTERVKFEINAAIYTYSERDLCQSPFLIAYMGYVQGFDAYSQMQLPQAASWYEPKTIYGNVLMSDNTQAFYGMYADSLNGMNKLIQGQPRL